MLKKIIIYSLATINLMAMHFAQLNINNSEIEAGLKFDIGQFNYSFDPDRTFVGIKYLKVDSDNSDYYDPKETFEMNFMVQQFLGSSYFFAGLGIKADYIDIVSTQDFFVIPLSAKIGYMFQTKIPVYIALEYHYAPEVLSFFDANGYKEFRINVDFELLRNALLNVGYRDIASKFDFGTYNTYNHAGYIGVEFKF